MAERALFCQPEKSCMCKNKGLMQSSLMTWSAQQIWSTKKRASDLRCYYKASWVDSSKKKERKIGEWEISRGMASCYFVARNQKEVCLHALWSFIWSNKQVGGVGSCGRGVTKPPSCKLCLTSALLLKQWINRHTFSSSPTCFSACRPRWDKARLMLLPFTILARRISDQRPHAQVLHVRVMFFSVWVYLSESSVWW